MDIKGIVKEYGSPCLVLDSQRLRYNYNNLKNALPNVDLYYAVKANSELEVLRILDKEGSFFDVASGAEIEKCIEAGIDVEKLLYTHPIKNPKDIEVAIKYGSNTFVIDNLYELQKLPIHSNIIIRVKTFDYECASNLSKKFGCEIKDTIDIALECKNRNMNVIGYCFHVGSQIVSNSAYADMLVCLKETYDVLEEKGFNLQLLDIGGGFPSVWSAPVDMYEFCAPIREHLKPFEKYRIIAEPGRYLVNSAFTMIYSIIGKSIRDEKIWYYVDEGIYGSFSTVIYDKMDVSIDYLKDSKETLEPCVLTGPTCDCIDIISENALLPSDLEIGDILLTTYLGAYSISCATNFNGFDKTLIVFV